MTYKMFAYFTGTDGSLGYRRGHSYELVVHEYGWFGRLVTGYTLYIERIDGSGQCPYRSFASFFDNWKVEYKPKGGEKK